MGRQRRRRDRQRHARAWSTSTCPDFPILSALADRHRGEHHRNSAPTAAYEKLTLGLADLRRANDNDHLVPPVQPGHEVRHHSRPAGPFVGLPAALKAAGLRRREDLRLKGRRRPTRPTSPRRPGRLVWPSPSTRSCLGAVDAIARDKAGARYIVPGFPPPNWILTKDEPAELDRVLPDRPGHRGAVHGAVGQVGGFGDDNDGLSNRDELSVGIASQRSIPTDRTSVLDHLPHQLVVVGDLELARRQDVLLVAGSSAWSGRAGRRSSMSSPTTTFRCSQWSSMRCR